MPIIRWPSSGFPRPSHEWRRKVEALIQDHETFIDRQKGEGQNLGKSQSSTMKRLASTIKAQPFTVVGHDSETGFGLSSGWNAVASVTISHPFGWGLLSLTAVGAAAAVDTTSGGLTICEARIVIGSSVSPSFAPAKDAGVSAVNNILTPNFGVRDVSATATDKTVCTLELRPLNPSAFPSMPGNYASLTINAVFTNES